MDGMAAGCARPGPATRSGDVFENAGGALPRGPSIYHEADVDLDESCNSRGPKRLIFSVDSAIYVTPDHYGHFIPVP